MIDQAIMSEHAAAVPAPAAIQGRAAASWPAIFAGAFVAASVSLILLALGAGLGFASVSPWPTRGASVTTFTVEMAIWLVVTQWISSGLGGYIAGRLRTTWVGTHSHEVFFRDTAHGLVTWAVGAVLVVVAAVASLDSWGDAAGRALSHDTSASAINYRLDKLFRTAAAVQPPQESPDPRMEASHLAAEAVLSGGLAESDRSYLTELVAARTGISQSDAQTRVREFVDGAMAAGAKARAEADVARKAAAEFSIYTALSMLLGAFIASVAAALGGRQRDLHP